MSLEHKISPDGYERVATVNLLSTWLMGLLLLPALRKSAAANPSPESATATALADGGNQPHLIIINSNAHFYTQFKCQKEPSILEFFGHHTNMLDRYGDTKLMSLFMAREVAAKMDIDGKPSVILNTVDPGSCKTQLLREDNTFPWYFRYIFRVGFSAVGRTAEMGARTYPYAAVAGWESHGIYLEDCKLSTPHEFVDSEAGIKMQKKVYTEVMGILETVQPGITTNI